MTFYRRSRNHARTHKRHVGGTGRNFSRGPRPMSRAISSIRRRRPTARTQQRQIMTNSYQLAKLWHRRYQHRVYTDYQGYSLARPVLNNITAFRLTDCSAWLACLRQDANVDSGSKTFCKRMQLSIIYDLGSCITPVYFQFWLCRTRYMYSSFDPTVDSMTSPNEIALNNLDDRDPHSFLNQGIFKVLHTKRHMLTYNSASQDLNSLPPAGKDSTGNPNTTHGRIFWDVPLKIKFVSPLNVAWRSKQWLDIPYYDRLYLLVHVGNDAAPVDPPLQPRVSTHQLFTCVNTD